MALQLAGSKITHRPIMQGLGLRVQGVGFAVRV